MPDVNGTSAPSGLTPYRNGERCWVLTNRNGEDWPEDSVAHYDSEAEARQRLAELRVDYDEDGEDYGPRDVRQLTVSCVILYCAEGGCGEEYEGDEFAHIHWEADDPQTALDLARDCDWKIGLDGQAYCPETLAVVDHTYVGADDPNDTECSECGFAESDHRFLHDPAKVWVLR